MENIKNHTVIITGTSSGFGRETAKLFASKGWNVIASMRNPEKESELSAINNVLVVQLDVQDPESIHTAISKGIEKFAKIDVLVNNAGFGLMGIFESSDRDQVQKQFDVNVFGMMDVTRALIPHFRTNGGGAIINISSFGGQVSLPIASLYNASKYAVEGFSESLAYELSAINVAVKIIEPGGVHTNFGTSLNFIANPPAEYSALIQTFMGRYGKVTEHMKKADAADVAETIFQAATDGSVKLRYIVGEDAEFYINNKMKNSDDVYLKKMRDLFID
jgi:NAD(P)-dependent dehydrogenase (short-subunit alcohol dehydrogenase family)